MSAPPSRLPTRMGAPRQAPPPPPFLDLGPVNMLPEPPMQNQNLPLHLFPNVVSPENRRPQPDLSVFFQGLQGEITPSPIAQAQAQIPAPPPPVAPQTPQRPPPQPQRPVETTPTVVRNLAGLFDDESDENDESMSGGRLWKRNARMSFYKIR